MYLVSRLVLRHQLPVGDDDGASAAAAAASPASASSGGGEDLHPAPSRYYRCEGGDEAVVEEVTR